MKFIPDIDNPQAYSVTTARPFDTRIVQPTVESLYHRESFTDFDGSYIDFRYEGMLVSVVGDIDSVTGEDRTGVYLLIDKTNKDNPSGWKKISCDCYFEWPPEPEPYDPEAHYYLDYNDGDPQWVKLVVHSGSGTGSGGYTTTEIPYYMLFEDEADGGLGLDRFGFLIPGTYTGDVIPPNTPYDDIFRSILDGHQIGINGLPVTQSKVYNGQWQMPDYTISKAAPSDYILQYSTSINGPWDTYSQNIIRRIDVGTDTYYFRLLDESQIIVIPPNESKTAKFSITKFKVIATSPSKEKVFDGEPLVSTSSEVTFNGFSNRVNILTTSNQLIGPGTLTNSFNLTLTDNNNLEFGSHHWGTLTVLPLIKYTTSPATQSPPILLEITKDLGLSGLPKVVGETNVYYVDGQSGLVGGVEHKFRLYVYGGQTIDTNNRWIFNDITRVWEKTTSTNKGQWEGIDNQPISTQQDYGKTTTIYTYSNKNSAQSEIPFDHIRLAFKVI